MVRCIARVAQWCGALLGGPVVRYIARVAQWCGTLLGWPSGAVHC